MITFFYWWAVLSVITTCIGVYYSVEQEGWETLWKSTDVYDLMSVDTFKYFYFLLALVAGFFLFPIMFTGLLLKIARSMK